MVFFNMRFGMLFESNVLYLNTKWRQLLLCNKKTNNLGKAKFSRINPTQFVFETIQE